MDFETVAPPAVLLITVTALILLISPDWRLSIGALAAQYLGVFILVAINWPLEMAVTKLVAGWMAGATLGISILSLPAARPAVDRDLTLQLSEPLTENAGPQTDEPVSFIPTSRVFRLLAAILVGLTVLSVAPQLTGWLPGILVEQAWGGLLLMGFGLLQLGFTAQPLRTILGLLTILSGFEILYAVVETSALVAGLLAGVNLTLALTGAYLLVSSSMEEAE